jgi:hypothetical protein
MNSGEGKKVPKNNKSQDNPDKQGRGKEDEEANMSLVSYEDTEEDEKYYNEEELTKILVCNQIKKSANQNTSVQKQTKIDEKTWIDQVNIFKQEAKEEVESVEEDFEYLFDKETLKYIESLKDKLDIDDDMDPQEFLRRIQLEINNPKITKKQKMALEELKKGLLDDLGQNPLELESEVENDFLDSEDDVELTAAEKQYLMYHHLQKNPEFTANNLDRLMIETDDQDSYQDLSQGYSLPYPNQNTVIRGFKQAEIMDSMKPQYYFNAKNKSRTNYQESEIESKESTSKTPWFIQSPTSGSQLGSMNSLGAVKAEDLIVAMKNKISQVKWRVNTSSGIVDIQPQPMSFGGEEDSNFMHDGAEKEGEFDTFRT